MSQPDHTHRLAKGAGIAGSDWLLVPLSLLLGALLVLGAILAYYMTGSRYEARAILAWPGQPLQVQAGKIEIGDQGITVTTLDAQGWCSLMLVTPILDASRYARLRIETTDLPPDTRLGMAWRDVTKPDGIARLWLPHPVQGTIEIPLDAQPRWRGGIAGLTLLIDAPPKPFHLQRIELWPTAPTPALVLRQLWTEWTAFTGWTGGSINFLYAGKPHGLVSPVLAAACWVVASTLLYALMRQRRRGPWRLAPFTVILLTGWVVLDARWQWELLRQVQITQDQFAGKTGREKRLAAKDRTLFLLAEKITGAMPKTPGRLFLVPPQLDGDYYYQRIRLHYLLLPLNVSSNWADLPTTGIRQGDHLFVWNGHKNVHWDPETGILSWQGQPGLAAEKILSTPAGNLYRIR